MRKRQIDERGDVGLDYMKEFEKRQDAEGGQVPRNDNLPMHEPSCIHQFFIVLEDGLFGCLRCKTRFRR